MMKRKFVVALLAIAGCFWACESESDNNPKLLLDGVTDEMAQYKVLGDLHRQIQGMWRSDDDSKSELRIEGDKVTSIYDGKQVSEERFVWDIKCSLSCSQGQEDLSQTLCFKLETTSNATCYGFVSLSEKKLKYSMMPGAGKTLSYTKTGDLTKK
jgi:hypothetical protein